MSSTIELTNGKATLEQRGEYLLVVETGTLVSPHEVYRYVTELELASQRLKLRRMLVDARSESGGHETAETRTAMWRWIRSQRYFDQVAYALRDEMTIARVNMTALSERLAVRAFASVPEAHRWLARVSSRMSSTSISAVRTPGSVPPPPMPPGSLSSATPGAGSSVPPRPSAVATEKLRRITLADLEPAPRPQTPTPTPDAPVTRSHATLKTPALDPASADEILRKRR